jgi:hypothetical protein
MLALGLAAVTLTIVEGNDWGWTATATLAAVVLRSRSHPRPIADRFGHRAVIVPGTPPPSTRSMLGASSLTGPEPRLG